VEEICYSSTVPAILVKLRGTYKGGRREVAETLIKVGKPAVPALIAALKDNDSDVRWWAAESLGKIGDNSAVPTLIEALRDSPRDVCEQAVVTLEKIGDKSTVPALETADRKYHNQGQLQFLLCSSPLRSQII
jgi:HEAT repeat protein